MTESTLQTCNGVAAHHNVVASKDNPTPIWLKDMLLNQFSHLHMFMNFKRSCPGEGFATTGCPAGASRPAIPNMIESPACTLSRLLLRLSTILCSERYGVY